MQLAGLSPALAHDSRQAWKRLTLLETPIFMVFNRNPADAGLQAATLPLGRWETLTPEEENKRSSPSACKMLPVKGLSLPGCSLERSTRESSWKAQAVFSSEKWRLCWWSWDQCHCSLFASLRVRSAFTVPAYPNVPALFPKKLQNMQKAKTDEQSLLESFGR